jgi:hypothetical protein
LSSTYKSDYFRDEKNFVYKPWSKPQGLKWRVIKYILIMERVKQLEISITRWHTLVLLWGNTLPAFKPNSKIQQSNEELLSNVSTVEVALKMLTTKQNRKPWDTPG